MLRIEEYEKVENEKQPMITCLSCGSNENPTSYYIKLFNHLGEWKIPLCKDCLDRIKVELEFIGIEKEEE